MNDIAEKILAVMANPFSPRTMASATIMQAPSLAGFSVIEIDGALHGLEKAGKLTYRDGTWRLTIAGAAPPPKEERAPFWARCSEETCRHTWPAAYAPMELGEFARTIAANIRCPMCGNKKPFVAKQENGKLLELDVDRASLDLTRWLA